MKLFRTTKEHKKFWKERKIDWHKDYTSTWNHPHRVLISSILKTFSWLSLIEVGCGSGANLIRICKDHAGKQLGGIDINRDAIEAAKKNFQGALLKVGSVEDIMLSDDATDIILSDACFIYIGPRRIDRCIKEIKRVARNQIVLCEFHSKSFWQRLRLRFESGYNAYNYQRLLEKHGFYDIKTYKIPKEVWPGTPWQEFGYILLANVPSHK